MRQINKIIIHCADTPNGKDFDVKDIRAWHVKRGWRDVGYHYVIRIDGEVEVGRAESDLGAHCLGHNHDSIGVCLIGRDMYSTVQWEALSKLVEDLVERYPGSEVVGHYEYDNNKTCPNFNVREWWKSDER